MKPRTCVRGTNILTDVKVKDNGMSLGYQEQQVMTVDFERVANVTTSKDEVVLEMRDDSFSKFAFNLAEMRFFVPNTRTEAESGNSAQALAERIRAHVKIDGKQQSKLFTFENVHFVVPRGKYSIGFYAKHFALRGPSYNYSIKYKNVQRCFLLPTPDKTNIWFVMSFRRPIEQGRSCYPHFLLQFPLDTKGVVESLVDENLLKEVSKKLKPKYESKSVYEAFGEIFANISGSSVILPDDAFRTVKGTEGMTCSVKANQGTLFLLRKSLIYLYKPSVMHIKYSNIEKVLIYRLNSSKNNRGFDLEVKTKTGDKVMFGDIGTEDSDAIMDNLKGRGIQVILKFPNFHFI